MTEIPKCPDCEHDMVPLSGIETGRARGYDLTVVLPFAKWVCVGCGKEVG